MNLIFGSTCWLDGDPQQEVIIVGPADSTKCQDQGNDSDVIFSPFLPSLSELVVVRHVDTKFEEAVELRRLRPAATAGDAVKRVEEQATTQ